MQSLTAATGMMLQESRPWPLPKHSFPGFIVLEIIHSISRCISEQASYVDNLFIENIEYIGAYFCRQCGIFSSPMHHLAADTVSSPRRKCGIERSFLICFSFFS
jgi:hypothetical protein